MRRVAFSVEGAHGGQPVRDLDANPNRAYMLASIGDDARLRFWDVRQPTAPTCVKHTLQHLHWCACLRSLSLSVLCTNLYILIYSIRCVRRCSHSRRLWCVRYNAHHDQLLLTAGSDARVLLHRACSVSSEAVHAGVPSAAATSGATATDSSSEDRSLEGSDLRLCPSF